MIVRAASDLSPAARAFDSIAVSFDEKFGQWLSVAAQRRAVRVALAEAFAPGSRLVEVGGGTGDDACWLVERGRSVLLTDASPAMVAVASAKLGGRTDCTPRVVAAEELETLAMELRRDGQDAFDGAYSNFAALNCVPDLQAVARGLARLLRPGAPALLVLFGTACLGEIVVEALRGRSGNMFRRFGRGNVHATLAGHDFPVHYHRKPALRAAMAPWFTYESRQAIGLAVPPSAAEPWISRHPRLLAILDRIDRRLSLPLAMFGDHVLYRFVRNSKAVDE